MKMRIYVIGIGILVAMLAGKVSAQVNMRVLKAFPAHIVQRIHEIMVLCPVSEESQWKLGDYFVRQDSLANVALRHDSTSLALSDYYRTSVEDLEAVLSPLELNDYRLKVQYHHCANRMRRMIQQREALQLTPHQVEALFTESCRLETDKNIRDFWGTEFHIADSILTPSVHKRFYGLLRESEIAENVKRQTKELAENNLLPVDMDSIQTYQYLCRCEMELQADITYWREAGNREKLAEAEVVYKLKNPKCLKRLELYWIAPEWSIIRYAIQKRNVAGLNLTEHGLDSLLLKGEEYRRLEQEKKHANEKFSESALDCQLAQSVLTKEGIDKLLAEKRKSWIQGDVEREMNELERYGLVNNANRESVLKELTDYKRQVGVSYEWAAIERSQENLFRLCDLQDHVPLILKKMEEKQKQERAEWKDDRF